MCSADGSPKREVCAGRSVHRMGLCCAGGRSGRRRPAEVITSQGAPCMAKEHGSAPTPLPWGNSRAGTRSPSPLHYGLDRDLDRARRGGRHRKDSGELRTRCSSPFRSPTSSFRTNTSSFHSSLGSSLACTGAAFGHQEDGIPVRGLYVSMQRGLGPPAPAGGGGRDALGRSRREARNSASQPPPRQRRGSLQETSVVQPRFSVPAASYEAVQEDVLDCLVEALARQLPANYGRALLLRRLSPGEYEVDGRRLGIGWQGAEVVVRLPKEDGTTSMEPLASYLRDAADRALCRAYATTPGPAAIPGGSLTIPVGTSSGIATAGAPGATGQHQEVSRHFPPPQTGSFFLRSGENGSFVLHGREGSFGGSSLGGSFYGVYGVSTAPTSCHSACGACVGKDPRCPGPPAPLPIAPHGTMPLVAAGQVPHPLQHCTTASFYMNMRGVPPPGGVADRKPSQALAPPRPPDRRVGTPPPGGGMCWAGAYPGMGLVTPPRTAMPQAAAVPLPAQVYAPSFIAVNG